jgi:ketosteroid isomerase-like protein
LTPRRGTAIVLDMDQSFFSALLSGDALALSEVLTDDFVLVDVMAGGVIRRDDLVGVVGSGEMVFASIELVGSPLVREYASTLAITVGETRMAGRFGSQSWSAHSRFTHVFVRADAGAPWRLASAQGTPIAELDG